MAEIASWLGKQWEVRQDRLLPVSGFSLTYELEKENNKDNEGKPPIYQKRFKEKTINLTSVFSEAAGVDIWAEYEEWVSLVGESAPLYLGGRLYGPPKVKLTAFKHTERFLNNSGGILVSDASFTFVEDAPEESGKKTSEFRQRSWWGAWRWNRRGCCGNSRRSSNQSYEYRNEP